MLPPEEFPAFKVHPPPALPGILLWDGDCGFCQRSVRFLRRIARSPIPETPLQSFHSPMPDIGDQIAWVTAAGQVFGGVRAIAKALSSAGRPVLAAVLTLPVLYTVFRTVYRVVARNRHRLGSQRCRLPDR
jgi:predicted DCC family thiol-disulfide oxidoreductase YuxK